MGHPWKKTVECDECGKTVKYLAQHKKMAHGKEADTSKGGDAVTQEQQDAVKRILAEEKKAGEAAKKAESERSDIVAGIKGIGDRLDKIDTDFCSNYPELCKTVSELKETMPKKLAEGSEEWVAETTAGLDHMLFGECPNCGPLRDKVLAAKGKRLADVEAGEEAKAEAKAKAKEEAEAKAKAEAEAEAKVDDPERETSLVYFPGSKWDEDKKLYVKEAE